jgi:hypothetical protein
MADVHEAAWAGNLDLLLALVADAAGTSAKTSTSPTPGNGPAVRARQLVAARDDNGYTALHYAAYQGHNDVVLALLRLGASPNERENDEATPLFLAAQQLRADVVRTLLDAGGDPTLLARCALLGGVCAGSACCDDGPTLSALADGARRRGRLYGRPGPVTPAPVYEAPFGAGAAGSRGSAEARLLLGRSSVQPSSSSSPPPLLVHSSPFPVRLTFSLTDAMAVRRMLPHRTANPLVYVEGDEENGMYEARTTARKWASGVDSPSDATARSPLAASSSSARRHAAGPRRPRQDPDGSLLDALEQEPREDDSSSSSDDDDNAGSRSAANPSSGLPPAPTLALIPLPLTAVQVGLVDVTDAPDGVRIVQKLILPRRTLMAEAGLRGGEPGEAHSPPTGAVSIPVSSLAPHRRFVVRVRAVNAFGPGRWSEPSLPFTYIPDAGPPRALSLASAEPAIAWATSVARGTQRGGALPPPPPTPTAASFRTDTVPQWVLAEAAASSSDAAADGLASVRRMGFTGVSVHGGSSGAPPPPQSAQRASEAEPRRRPRGPTSPTRGRGQLDPRRNALAAASVASLASIGDVVNGDGEGEGRGADASAAAPLAVASTPAKAKSQKGPSSATPLRSALKSSAPSSAAGASYREAGEEEGLGGARRGHVPMSELVGDWDPSRFRRTAYGVKGLMQDRADRLRGGGGGGYDDMFEIDDGFESSRGGYYGSRGGGQSPSSRSPRPGGGWGGGESEAEAGESPSQHRRRLRAEARERRGPLPASSFSIEAYVARAQEEEEDREEEEAEEREARMREKEARAASARAAEEEAEREAASRPRAGTGVGRSRAAVPAVDVPPPPPDPDDLVDLPPPTSPTRGALHSTFLTRRGGTGAGTDYSSFMDHGATGVGASLLAALADKEAIQAGLAAVRSAPAYDPSNADLDAAAKEAREVFDATLAAATERRPRSPSKRERVAMARGALDGGGQRGASAASAPSSSMSSSALRPLGQMSTRGSGAPSQIASHPPGGPQTAPSSWPTPSFVAAPRQSAAAARDAAAAAAVSRAMGGASLRPSDGRSGIAGRLVGALERSTGGRPGSQVAFTPAAGKQEGGVGGVGSLLPKGPSGQALLRGAASRGGGGEGRGL